MRGSVRRSVPVVGARSYHDTIIDHYENPRNVGSLDKNAEDVGTGLVGAPACGDVMKLQIKVRCGANDNHPTHPLISVGAMDITRRPDDPGA